jgi:hypothetical protein
LMKIALFGVFCVSILILGYFWRSVKNVIGILMGDYTESID